MGMRKMCRKENAEKEQKKERTADRMRTGENERFYKSSLKPFQNANKEMDRTGLKN